MNEKTEKVLLYIVSICLICAFIICRILIEIIFGPIPFFISWLITAVMIAAFFYFPAYMLLESMMT